MEHPNQGFADWVRQHEVVAEDVVKFFCYAPPIVIKEVQDRLLQNGLELQFGIAPAIVLTPQFGDQ